MEPWEAYPSIWKTKAAFFAYLRGGLRSVWSRYPAKLKWKDSQTTTEKPEGYTGRGKSFGKCHYCGEMFTKSSLEVDHVQQAGTCNSWETANEFLHNLLDVNNNWVLACRPCHKIKSYAERSGTDFAEAMLQKQVIAFMKRGKDEILNFCHANGYPRASLKTVAQRKQAVTEILRQQKESG